MAVGFTPDSQRLRPPNESYLKERRTEMFSKSAFLCTLVLLSALVVPSRAEVVKLSGGTVSRGGFSISGPGLSFSGSFSGFWWHSTPCTPCFPGNQPNLSNGFFLDTTDLSFVSITVDGTRYYNWGSFVGDPPFPYAMITTSMDFRSSAVSVPFIDAPHLTLVAPFTMDGGVGGRGAYTTLFGKPFTGRGEAYLYLTRIEWSGEPAYMFQGMTYYLFRGVDIDVKPGDEPNYINTRSEGKTPIAILSTATFDAGTINPLTIHVSGAPVSLKKNGTTASSLEDVNGDGLLDLVIHVSTQDLEFINPNEVLLEGYTIYGQRLWGTDEIILLP